MDADEAEARVAQLWFWEGYYARRGVNLQRHFDPEPLLVTDLDLLAFSFTPNLARGKHIGEVKTGVGKSAPKPLDRIIWLRGLRELVGAEDAELTSAIRPSPRARQLARDLRVTAQSLDDLRRREEVASVHEVANTGAHGVQSLEVLKQVHKQCSTDIQLERAFWFLRSEVWFLDPLSACKRTIGLLRRLAARWTPQIDDEDARALRWLLAEAVSVFGVNVVPVAGLALSLDREQLTSYVGERLSEGAVPAHQMRRLARDIDKYFAGVLTAAGAPAHIKADALGAFHPQPPDYTEPFIELVVRLGTVPLSTLQLPRQLDLLVHERVVHRRHVPGVAADRLMLARDGSGRVLRQLAAFLRNQAGLPDVVDKALTAPLAAPDSAASVVGGPPGALPCPSGAPTDQRHPARAAGPEREE